MEGGEEVFIMRRILVYKTEDPLVCSYLVKGGFPVPAAHVALSNRPELWLPPEIPPLYPPAALPGGEEVFIMRRILVYKTGDPLVCSYLVKRGCLSPTAHV